MSDDDNNVWWLTPFYHRQLLQGYRGLRGGLGGIEEGMGVAKDGSGKKLKLRGGSSESEWSFLPLGLGCLHSSRFRILWLNKVQIVHIVQALKDFRQVEIFCSTNLELSRPGMKIVFWSFA